MTEELTWGFPIIIHLFLVALGAGAFTVSASILLRGGAGGFGGHHFKLARYGALIAPIPVMLDGLVLIFELGSFQAGHWFRWINLYKTINLAPMSVGTWLITLFICVSLIYAYTYLALPEKESILKRIMSRFGVSENVDPGDRWHVLRIMAAWVGVPLGLALAVYTGVLLSAMPSRPFWNSPILALLFLCSSLSIGIAVITLGRLLTRWTRAASGVEPEYQESGYLLTASDVMLIGFQLVSIFLFVMYAHLAVGEVKIAVSVIMLGGSLATMFWFWVVLIGLLVPGLTELVYVVPKLIYHKAYAVPRAVEVFLPVTVLVGAFMMRYVVVVAGQITGPVGL